jgi:hypothetical protein
VGFPDNEDVIGKRNDGSKLKGKCESLNCCEAVSIACGTQASNLISEGGLAAASNARHCTLPCCTMVHVINNVEISGGGGHRSLLTRFRGIVLLISPRSPTTRITSQPC